MVNTTTQLHSTKPEIRFFASSNPAYSMLEIRDGEELWQWSRLEIKRYAFRRSTTPQKLFIIIIIIINSSPMGCQSAEYPEPPKNLGKLACIKEFPQTLQSSFTFIHPINTTGLFNYHVRKLPVVWCHQYSLLSFLPFWVCCLHISGSHSFLNIPLSLSQTSKTSSRQCKNKSSIYPLNPQKPLKSQQQPLCPTSSNIAL